MMDETREAAGQQVKAALEAAYEALADYGDNTPQTLVFDALDDLDVLLGDNARLRAEQDNAGFVPWRLAQDAIDELIAERDSLRSRVKELEAERERAEAVLVAADRVKEAYDAMIEGRDVGFLPDWTAHALSNTLDEGKGTDASNG